MNHRGTGQYDNSKMTELTENTKLFRIKASADCKEIQKDLMTPNNQPVKWLAEFNTMALDDSGMRSWIYSGSFL